VYFLTALLLLQSFPEGPGKNTFESICNFCHPASFVQTKALTKAEWQTLITEMLRGGDIATAQEKDAIVAYLAKNFPKTANVNTASAKDLETILEIPALTAATIVASRQATGAIRSMEDLQRITGLTTEALQEIRNRVVF